MYILIVTEDFDLSYKKVTKGNQNLQKRIQKALKLLKQDPFYPSLKTHKVTTRNYGEKWSSWATGDIRIIWHFDENQQLTILLLSVSSHSGTHREYK